MKRFSWKKMMSLVVALALVVGVLHFGTRVSAETEADAAATAALTNGNIQFTVDREFLKTGGNQVHSDVIIVIDCSVSMGNRVRNTNPSQTRLQVAKAQAQAFKDELDKDPNVTVVGIFGFGGYATEVEKISDISTISGTNVDDALEKAQAKFKAMTTVSNPTIVILTDGEANRANKHEGETGNATALTVAQINNALNDDNIKIYAIDFGEAGTIFTNNGINNTNGNLTNSSTSTFSSTELAAAFKNITTAIQTYTVDNAKIVAKLTDFVNYVGPVNDDIEYDKNTIIWHIDDGDITDVNYKEVKSPEFAFKLVDPNSPQAEGETDADYQARVARALINYAKGGTKVDGVVTSTDGIVKYEPLADGKVKITVKITADNDTKLYFNINGAAQTPKNVNNLDTLTAI
ncbi:MAG: VWA domain-containing protein, partial [Lachnospiraceae bacterium]|nr:VWA domain-containing protein [Lachnospiraceae bacterium]